MKFFDNIKDSIKKAVTFSDDEDYDDDENYGDDDYEEEEEESYEEERPSEKVKYDFEMPSSNSGYTVPEYQKNTGKSSFSSGAQQPKTSTANIYKMDSVKTTKKLKVTLFVLEDMDDARNVADCMIDKGVVTLADMTKLPTESVRRVLDFLDGVKYVCKSKIEVIAEKIYLIVPEAAELSGDFFGQVDRPSFF